MNGQISVLGFVGLSLQSFLFDMVVGGPSQSTTESMLQTHQQHVPKRNKNRT